MAGELGEILEEDDLALVLRAEHRPNSIIQLMTHSVKSIEFKDGEQSCLVSHESLDCVWQWHIMLDLGAWSIL